MNKSQLIEKIAAGADISKAAAGRALDAIIASVTESLKEGDDVALVGFGTFAVKERAARTGRNPQTGKEITSCHNRLLCAAFRKCDAREVSIRKSFRLRRRGY